MEEQADDVNVSKETSDAEQAPVVRLVNAILINAIRAGSSDIHLEPFENEFQVRYRIDGVLRLQQGPPKSLQNPITSRLKVISEMDIAERRQPQDGRFRVRYKGRFVDFRVSIMPSIHGEDAVLRVLDKETLSEKRKSTKHGISKWS